MKKLILISYLLMVSSIISAQQSKSPSRKLLGLTGPYFGQKPPGMTPEIFAPGIVSLPGFVEYSGTFSPDGMEYYFYRFSDSMPATIYCSKMISDDWTVPEPVVFSSGYPEFEPHITFDNRSLYFGWFKGNPAIPGIWVAKRDSESWSAPKYAGQDMFVSSDSMGNIYTTDMSSRNINGKTYLAKVTVNNDLFTNYQRLNISAHYGTQAHPGIAPDGSYLIFDVQSGNYMYVSFKKQDGTWGEAVDLTNHGFDPMAGGATVSPDGKYLFFCLNRDIWWVSTEIIDQLRPAKEVLAYIAQDHLPPNEITEIFLINSDGSGKTQLTNQPERRPYDPAFSPDGSQIAHYTHINHTTWSLWIMNADGSNIRRLTSGSNTLDWMPRWSPDGKTIIFTRSFMTPTWRSEIWTIKPDGTNQWRIGSMDGEGGDYSPDGSKIAFSSYFEGGGDIWIMNADGTNPVQLTTNPSEDWNPKFSPDGSKIAFESMRDGNFEIYVMHSDGSNQVRLTNNLAEDIGVDWSPDGSRIDFVSERDGHSEIYIMNADGTNQTRLTYTNGRAISPDWKPVTDPTSIEAGKRSSDSVPGKFQLFQNYPNPFNPETTIVFHLPAKKFVTLKILDVLGREVAMSLQNTYEAGLHEVLWNGTAYSSGIYFYQLTSNRFQETKKMILAK